MNTNIFAPLHIDRLALLKSKNFQSSLDDSLKSLKGRYYVPVKSRKTLKYLIETLIKQGVEEKFTSVVEKLNSSKRTLLREDKDFIISKLEPYILPIMGQKNDVANVTINDLCEKLDEMNIDDSKHCFAALTYETLDDGFVDATQNAGAHSWKILPNKISVTGELPRSSFEEAFKKQWNDDTFSAETVLSVIDYDTEEPIVIREEGLVQGLALDYIPKYVQGKSEAGTIGGFVHYGSKLFAITAGHCLTSDFIRINDTTMDVGLIEVSGSDHETLFSSVVNESSHNFSEVWSSVFKDPVGTDDKLFEEGTEVFKIGATTGITRGYICDHRDVYQADKTNGKFGITKVNWKEMIVVRWLPGQRFSAPGDSGSIYYVARGCGYLPIAVHRGSSTRRGIDQSYGTPIYQNFDRLPEAIENKYGIIDNPDKLTICQYRLCSDGKDISYIKT